ncbi:MAG: Nif11-like leader peptide family natural product precursor [Tatlockia sp.]|jgi:predicted ribosomally synthesized peptide with nif11-like leader|uniref:Nif11-like leader peptide family natural product precursor n=1 Tax=Chlorogloea sp. CCALA 695 TaxID=2107693 RepID=UPI000D079AB2|nr:Nif11-like leader peptide family natural product precursor [Chlorogloea sp. CCALA 695]MBA2747809.1 Nif11-like leader peptide family natural product precursor [Tatlockia sp.]PSB30366.1 Nif11-like leader peptide family natural product precursor [Chlorogloea sp. CCALA 695]
MTQENAARFFKSVQQDQGLKAKLKAIDDPETFLQIAEGRGYQFTLADLDAAISNLSHEEMASVINPGISPRRHLTPR